ncbi:MAG: energy transducer TonB [Bacteroidales bacterium]|nr:energy transducer TonB [Bacteroidales bacterium]
MEIKKSPKASLENKRLLFTEIGLVVALLLVYGAFEYSTRESKVAFLEDTTQIADVEEMIAIQNETPPPPPEAPKVPQLSDQIDIVDDEIKLDDDMFMNLEDDANTGVEIMDYQAEEVVEEEVVEEAIPFQLVEEKPKFNGGDANEFSKWVNSKLQYPEIAKENGVQGRVTLQFTVNADGSVSNVRVLRGVDESLDKEAVRVVSMSPKWKPGRQRDRAVKVTYTFPVIFQLR